MLSNTHLGPKSVNLSKKTKLRQLLIAGTLASSLALTACVPLVVGGAAVSVATVVSDRRPASMQANDKKISIYAENKTGAVVPSTLHPVSFVAPDCSAGRLSAPYTLTPTVSFCKTDFPFG